MVAFIINLDGSFILFILLSVFKKKFIKLLTRTFRQMEYKLAMRYDCCLLLAIFWEWLQWFNAPGFCSILDPKINFSEVENAVSPSTESLNSISETLSSYAMVQLESYTNNLAPHQMVWSYTDDDIFKFAFAEATTYFQSRTIVCK